MLFRIFGWSLLSPSIFLSCFYFQTISQRNSETNPLPPLISVAGYQNMCIFWFFSLSLLSQHWFWGKGRFKVFAFHILKVALVAPLYFLTDCRSSLNYILCSFQAHLFCYTFFRTCTIFWWMITCMKKTNNFQIVKVQPQGVV